MITPSMWVKQYQYRIKMPICNLNIPPNRAAVKLVLRKIFLKFLSILPIFIYGCAEWIVMDIVASGSDGANPGKFDGEEK